MQSIKIFLLLWVASIGLIYAYVRKGELPFMLPGDYIIVKASRKIYIPLGTSFIITIVLFILLIVLRSRIL